MAKLEKIIYITRRTSPNFPCPNFLIILKCSLDGTSVHKFGEFLFKI